MCNYFEIENQLMQRYLEIFGQLPFGKIALRMKLVETHFGTMCKTAPTKLGSLGAGRSAGMLCSGVVAMWGPCNIRTGRLYCTPLCRSTIQNIAHKSCLFALSSSFRRIVFSFVGAPHQWVRLASCGLIGCKCRRRNSIYHSW